MLEVLAKDPLLRAQEALYDAAMHRPGAGVGADRFVTLMERSIDVGATVGSALAVLGHTSIRQEVSDAPRGGVIGAIVSGARVTGTPPGYLIRTAKRESGLRANAAATSSSARGLFQFVEQTWLITIARHGARHGRTDLARAVSFDREGRAVVGDATVRAYILALRHDPWLSSRMAGALTADNRRHLEKALGRRPDEGDLYVAHFLGAAHATRLIAAAQRTPAADASRLFGRAASANPALFYQAGRPLSARAVLERLRNG